MLSRHLRISELCCLWRAPVKDDSGDLNTLLTGVYMEPQQPQTQRIRPAHAAPPVPCHYAGCLTLAVLSSCGTVVLHRSLPATSIQCMCLCCIGHCDGLPRVCQRPGRRRAGWQGCGAQCRRVCTPCYRAPEVVLSRGRYSSAMDMWSLGCIFGELLQRMERTGASFTPNLAIMPVFQFSTWSPNTPDLGVSLRDADDAIAGRVQPPPSTQCPRGFSSRMRAVCSGALCAALVLCQLMSVR